MPAPDDQGVYLCASHAHLRSCIDVHSAVRFSGNARADDICNSDAQRAPFETVSKGNQRFCRFAGLADKEADVVAENGRFAVQKVAGKLGHGRDFDKLFENGPRLWVRDKAGCVQQRSYDSLFRTQ